MLEQKDTIAYVYKNPGDTSDSDRGVPLPGHTPRPTLGSPRYSSLFSSLSVVTDRYIADSSHNTSVHASGELCCRSQRRFSLLLHFIIYDAAFFCSRIGALFSMSCCKADPHTSSKG